MTMQVKVKKLKIIDVNEVTVLDIADKGILLETEEGFCRSIL